MEDVALTKTKKEECHQILGLRVCRTGMRIGRGEVIEL